MANRRKLPTNTLKRLPIFTHLMGQVTNIGFRDVDAFQMETYNASPDVKLSCYEAGGTGFADTDV